MSKYAFKEKSRRSSTSEEAVNESESSDQRVEEQRVRQQKKLAELATDTEVELQKIDECLAENEKEESDAATCFEKPEPSAQDREYATAYAHLVWRALHEGRSVPPELAA